MAHYGMLREYRFSDDVDDIRGATLYDANDDKIGKIDDVIFDHSTGTIEYAVVDAGGWLSTKKFLVPADRVRPYGKNENDFATSMTKEQIKSLPEYDEKHVDNDTAFNDYREKHRESLDVQGGVMHREGSTHMLTPDPNQLPATGPALSDEEELQPDRLTGKYPEAAPNPSKLRLRPEGLAGRAEDGAVPGVHEREDIPTGIENDEELSRRQPTSVGASSTSSGNPLVTERTSSVEAQRDHLTNPDQVYVSEDARHRRWSAFENHLRRNRVDITASCRSCGTAKDHAA